MLSIWSREGPQAGEMPASVCKLNRIVQVTEAMLLAVEALASRGEPSSFSGVCLPELYERYAGTFHQLRQVESLQDLNQLAAAIGADIANLWSALKLFDEEGLQQWPEMDHLWTIWREQYGQVDCSPLCETGILWQPVNCLRLQIRRGGGTSPMNRPHSLSAYPREEGAEGILRFSQA